MYANLDEFQAAVLLNNTGIALLQGNCYVQALESLGDALAIMKRIASCSGASGKDDSAKFVQNKLNACSQRMANRQAVDMTNVNQRVVLQVLPDTYDPHALLATGAVPSLLQLPWTVGVSTSSPSITTMYLIVVGATDFHQDAAVLTAVILYNYSVAELCFAAIAPAKRSSEQQRYRAFRMLQLTNSILNNHGDLGKFYVALTTPYTCSQLVTLLVLRHLMEMSLERGMEDQYKDYSRRFFLFQDFVLARRTAPAA